MGFKVLFGCLLVLILQQYANAEFENCTSSRSFLKIGDTMSIHDVDLLGSCRYRVVTLPGSYIQANCYVELADTTCNNQRFLFSRSGDISLADAQPYCSTGPYNFTSIGTELVLAITTSSNTKIPSLDCRLESIPAVTGDTYAEFGNCKSTRNITIGESMTIRYNYGQGSCRYRIVSPIGSYIQATCMVNLEDTTCKNQKFLFSRNGDISFADAQRYCLTGKYSITSRENKLVMAMINTPNTVHSYLICYLNSMPTVIGETNVQFGNCKSSHIISMAYDGVSFDHSAKQGSCHYRISSPFETYIEASCTIQLADKTCNNQRFIVSRSGDENLADAQRYCVTGSYTFSSISNELVLAIVMSPNTASFKCRFRSVPALDYPYATLGPYARKEVILNVDDTIILKYGSGAQIRNEIFLIDSPADSYIEASCFVLFTDYTCNSQKFGYSRTGDINLADVQTYCDYGTYNFSSIGNTLVLAFIKNKYLNGEDTNLGYFRCNFKAVSAISAGCDCGWNVNTKIEGISPTGANEFVSQAGLVLTGQRVAYCGAVIIGHKYAITAAHCVDKNPAKSYLIAGSKNIFRAPADTKWAASYKVQSFTKHPGYIASRGVNDIALVQTYDNIRYNSGVGPACIPYEFMNKGSYFNTKELIAVGWGARGLNEPNSDVLLKTPLIGISVDQCQSFRSNMDSTKICAVGNGVSNACGQGSGDGLYWRQSNNLYIIGIVTNGTCAAGNPVVSTRVAFYVDWLETQVRGGFCRKT